MTKQLLYSYTRLVGLVLAMLCLGIVAVFLCGVLVVAVYSGFWREVVLAFVLVGIIFGALYGLFWIASR